VGWLGIRLASVYCMTQLLLRVQKTLVTSITVTAPAADVQNKYGDSFVNAWEVEAIVWSGC